MVLKANESMHFSEYSCMLKSPECGAKVSVAF